VDPDELHQGLDPKVGERHDAVFSGTVDLAATQGPPRSDPQKSQDFRPRGVLEEADAPILQEPTIASECTAPQPGRAHGELGHLLKHVDLKLVDQGPAQRPPTSRRPSALLPLIDRSISNSASSRQPHQK
jgi:hypothetical protein